MLKVKQRKGVVLLIVLATIMVVVILGNIILTIMSSQARLTHHQVSRIRAYYAAQAGVNLALEQLRRGVWGYNATYCITRNPFVPLPPECIVSNSVPCTDPDMPYDVIIRIGQQGTGGPSNTTPINVTVNYTYIPPTSF